MPETRKRNEKGLTERQEKFLVAYSELLDVYKAAKVANIAKSNIMADLRRDTPFATEYKELCGRIEEDPRLTKSGSVGRLLQMIKDVDVAVEAGEVKLLEGMRMKLDIQKEINKMVEGHLAGQKKTINKNILNVQGTYDFTKLNAPEEPKAIEIGYEEITD